jgi:tetratricopeptide (TPR) repeat protein
MRRSLAPLALLSLALAVPSGAQAPAAQTTPQALTAAYNQAVQARDWTGALTAAQKLVDLSASSQNLRQLANAQLYSGASDASLATYDRSLAAAQQEKPAEGQPDAAWKDNLAQIYTGRGNGLLKLHRTDEAIASYNQAATFSLNPGLAYFNICAVLYNNGNTAGSAAACRKCVQADPTRANAWFVLGSDIFADAPITNGNVIVPAEARQALQKYLELAPDGPHAADAKAMLQMAAK